MTIRHLDRLLTPGSVAVFGASNRQGSVGATVWRNLRAGQFAGPVYAVNPKHSTLDGIPVFATASQLPAAPDLALLCTPAHAVAPLVAELGALGTRAVVIVTAGLTLAQKQAIAEFLLELPSIVALSESDRSAVTEALQNYWRQFVRRDPNG